MNIDKKLTKEEEDIIVRKGTEAPFSGKYDNFFEEGIYKCKQCGAPLYKSENKFDASCGWPAFDDEIPGAVKHSPDAPPSLEASEGHSDGVRTEISCAKCGGHLGHVFKGENFTPKNIRHCVNSLSLDFVPSVKTGIEREGNLKAYFAGGCFWGVEYFLKKAEGVISTRVGYMGGYKKNPTYEEVCGGTTGHLETVEVTYDPEKTDFEKLAKLFFEIHDPAQPDGQGPDIGEQYLSAIFYVDDSQKNVAEELLARLKENGCEAATKLKKASDFWPAEQYHQDYYNKLGRTPVCHAYTKRF